MSIPVAAQTAISVDGIIESTGGFRFPDGSVQMTAVEEAAVPDTGQQGCWDAAGSSIACSGTGQDGELQRGLAWPAPRFTDNANGTVTDNLTGLVWLTNADCFGTRTWTQALADANDLMTGSCGLTDGSLQTSWRLPSIKEVLSLVDHGESDPAIPTGHPFIDVRSAAFDGYWSSTTLVRSPSSAWDVKLFDGTSEKGSKVISRFVWPVRGGQ